ncbi:MAG: sigma-54-dependent Fis family transcriptional regulator [Syntrophomonas sp.]|nr:sigma-54-dependent Fis family transcriptional regulator [Syntrophomonas sp.]
MSVSIKSPLTEIKAAWQTFIVDGKPGDCSVTPEIVESWQRCYEAGVDPYDGTCYHFLNQTKLADLLAKRQDFIDIARPFMLKLFEFVKDSGFIVILTDERGYIMEIFGDEDTLDQAQGIHFIKGADWTEESVGTNAIGTAVVLKRPIQTSGAEHYCQKHHAWTCSASPIFNMNGQMIGILDMSGPSNKTHLHTLGMVVAAVEAIKDQIRIQKKNRELTIANDRLTDIFQTMSDGVMIIDKQGVVIQINPVAEQIIGRPSEELMGKAIKEIVGREVHGVEKVLKRQESFSDSELMVDTIDGRIHCLSSGMPLFDDEGVVSGAVILVRPMEKVQKLVNRFSGAQAIFHFNDVIGDSREMTEVVRVASLAASGSSNILLEGESGTGKEVLAQAIHNRSVRRKGPFVAVNCGAIPRELIGSELFGYSEGAFTGAKRGGRPGKFELAAGGTLFLDEIGEMPLEQQVALLRVLQDKKITRIGDDKIIPVDFRVICATNKNILEEINKGNFRQDLYYRINVVAITLPPLRNHPEDIPTLVDHFMELIGRESGRKVMKVDQEVMEYLKEYDWPGNVRELQNVVERIISMSENGLIHLEHLPPSILRLHRDFFHKEPSAITRAVRVYSEREKRKQLLAENECQEMLKLLTKHGGNISEVAKEMEVSRNTIYRKMRQYAIDY